MRQLKNIVHRIMEQEKNILQNNADAIASKNLASLKTCTLSAATLLLTMVILINTVFTIIHDLTYLYLAGLLFSSAMLFIINTVTSKNKTTVLPLFYFTFTVLLFFFLIGAIFTKNCRGSALPFCTTLLTFSVFALDKSKRVYICILIYSLVFLILKMMMN